MICSQNNLQFEIINRENFYVFEKVQIPGMAQPISLSLTGATGNTIATANAHQTGLQLGKSKFNQRDLYNHSKCQCERTKSAVYDLFNALTF